MVKAVTTGMSAQGGGWDHQAKQKEQMIGAVENMEKTKVHEAHGD